MTDISAIVRQALGEPEAVEPPESILLLSAPPAEKITPWKQNRSPTPILPIRSLSQ